MRPKDVLERYADGDERGWLVEFEFLWAEHRDRLEALVASVLHNGIKEPILLGSDGRVWDGHHRLAVAINLGLPTIPVSHA